MKITPAYAAAAVAIVAVAAILALLLSLQAPPASEEITLSGEGQLVVAVKDKPIPTEFGNVSGVLLTVNKISVHFAGDKVLRNDRNEDGDAEVEEDDGSDEKGWITVFQGIREFNLLDYTDNVLGILSDANLSAGKYTEIRLYLTRSTIQFATTPLPTVYRLTVPGSLLKLKKGFIIRPNETLLLTLDFDINKSISYDQNAGEFRLKPVIKILAKEHGSHNSLDEIIAEERQQGREPRIVG